MICNDLVTVFCDHPGVISCGSTALRGGLIDGGMVTYTPAANAQLIGPTTLTCKNGKWSAPVPKCRCELMHEVLSIYIQMHACINKYVHI